MKRMNISLKRIKKAITRMIRIWVIKTIPSNWLSCDENSSLIVSLTTYGSRINTVDLAVKSIMLQSRKPSKIYLWLSTESDDIVLPDRLSALVPYGLEIIRGCENLKGHKKYLYAMKKFKKQIVVTIDDDVIYPYDTLDNLYTTYMSHPGCIVARRVHRLIFKDDEIAPYGSWIWECRDTAPSNLLLATGVGGILYPPDCFDTISFDTHLIKKYAIDADDIWLKIMEIRLKKKVVWSKNDTPHPYPIDDSQSQALWKMNVKSGGNDSVLKSLICLFDLKLDDFQDYSS